MLRYVYADQIDKFPKLRDTMFRDRADQFQTRLGWDVAVADNGYEKDEYDELNPLYVIWEMPDGSHGGSMRFCRPPVRSWSMTTLATLWAAARLSAR